MDSTTAMYCTACGRRLIDGEPCPCGQGRGTTPPPQASSRRDPHVPPPLPPRVHATTPPHVPPPLPARKPRRSFVEILLDPRSIQWLLASGGVLLVTGLVIWLASLGIFKNALVVAGALGIGTVLLLMSGWYIVGQTRYHLAGKAITLLACLAMPLNLWFYHANKLLTLDGNLWMAAVVCCALYAASAIVLRDPLFVYVLMAGVAGTGLLILQDMGKFAEIATPSLMLTVMGLIGIHAERAFLDNDSPFSRSRFGKAFFFSGHALLASGLLLLLGAQTAAWLLKPIFTDLPAAQITTDPSLKLLALVIVLMGSWAYVYSDVVVRKVGTYVYPAALTLLWAELLCLQMLHLHYRPELIVAVVSLTALVLNVLQSMLPRESKTARAITPLGLVLSALPACYGVLLHLRATHTIVHSMWPYTETWGYVAAMIIAAAACRVGAYLHRRTDTSLTWSYLFLTGAATLVGAAGLLAVLGINAWATQAPILMVIPIAYVIASRLYKDTVERDALLAVARAATAVMIVSVLASATHIAPRVFEPVRGQPLNLLLAIFFAEGAIFYIIVSAIRQQAFHIFLATAMAGGAVWQCLSYFHTTAETYMLTFAGLGLLMLIVSRIMKGNVSRSAQSAGNAMMTLSFLSSALMVASRVLSSSSSLNNAGLLGIMTLLTLAAAIVVNQSSWRHGYIIMSIINGMLAFVVLGVMIHLSPWQKAEIFFSAVGVLMLIAGHVGWFREQGSQGDFVTFNLVIGAILAGLPVFIATAVNRFGFELSLPDEIALVTISALMLITGVMLQIRSTTIIGGSLLALYLAMLLVFVGWEAQLAMGVYLTAGGALVFLLGLSLAIYRDRLLALPDKIHKREGVFKVLAWR